MNVYYSPEQYGLRIIGEVQWDYQTPTQGLGFHLTVVWRTDTDTYHWAEDAGCSCPAPFDGYTLNDLYTGTAEEAIEALITDKRHLQRWPHGHPHVVDVAYRLTREDGAPPVP